MAAVAPAPEDALAPCACGQESGHRASSAGQRNKGTATASRPLKSCIWGPETVTRAQRSGGEPFGTNTDRGKEGATGELRGRRPPQWARTPEPRPAGAASRAPPVLGAPSRTAAAISLSSSSTTAGNVRGPVGATMAVPRSPGQGRKAR